MLYDPKWNKKEADTKPNLQGFIAWLEQQDPDTTYNYWSWDSCAIAQYMKSIGTDYHDEAKTRGMLICSWNGFITRPFPQTMGGALERARHYQHTTE
jgi:hypothetical protein